MVEPSGGLLVVPDRPAGADDGGEEKLVVFAWHTAGSISTSAAQTIVYAP
jgi:hypothetical protein